MSHYKISHHAKLDLQRIYQYGFEQFGEEQADSYFWGFFDCFEKISERPEHYPAVDHIRIGYRRCVYKADTIYFRIQSSQVEIMAILGGQDVDEWL
ncbi:type II toxin-antitoxin system RelE/ParE family toxin [Marinobacterium sp. LSUCC0821]|uniref:type II toxin-antitoxin system RelE/ParE family toxin n=1 Tax=Marinobacterium sp. LSUCC0821 TaxID=2668067 RepID=UPI0014513F32|nr:type II toxin-antitoxin system RelE/ParE family toxin [Marinobacterium sp. LSUCC0821]QJD72196.1 type II toxin-antitoxin system RelE/ParE family toxin [Marinobacterium sp. LSUCC0821]